MKLNNIINNNTGHAHIHNTRARVTRTPESEKATERYLVERIKLIGGLCLKYSSQTTIGFPDRLLLLPGGMAAWVEVKSENAEPRRVQRIAIDRLRALGFRAAVCDSKAAVDAFLSDLIKSGQ